MFCVYFGFEYLPLKVNTLLCYAQFLTRSLTSVSGVRNYVSGVKTLARLLDFDPLDNLTELRLFFRGLSRKTSKRPKQALPITPQMLVKFSQLLEFTDFNHMSIWTCMLFMFHLMLRKSNVVAMSVNKFDSKKQLLRSDIKLGKNVMLVSLKWSKTNQFGVNNLKLPLVRSGNILCPVQAYRCLLRLKPLSEDSPVFCMLKGAKCVPMVYSDLQAAIKSFCEASGFDSSCYSSHSFRRGGASWAFYSGVPADLIQLHGDWASDCYKKYLHVPLESRFQVSEKMNEKMLGFL